MELLITFYHKGGCKTISNEELAAAYQAGDRAALLVLWWQVRRLVVKYANRWRGVGRLELEDLEQCGFIAVMEAASTYSDKAAFNTWLDVYIKKEFNIACGQRTERQRRDPLLNALSLDAPLTDDTEDPFTLADTLEDPAAATALEAAEDRDRADRLHAILSESIATLTPEQQTAVRDRYWRQRRVDAKVLNKALARLRHPSVSRQLLAYR